LAVSALPDPDRYHHHHAVFLAFCFHWRVQDVVPTESALEGRPRSTL